MKAKRLNNFGNGGTTSYRDLREEGKVINKKKMGKFGAIIANGYRVQIKDIYLMVYSHRE